MTDKEALVTLLDRFEIPYMSDDGTLYIGNYDHYDHKTKMHTSIPECDKVKGYSGFYAHWQFNSDGKFEEMGVWE